MTDLTEQCNKGELKEGYYYVRDGENIIAELLDGYFYNDGQPMTSFSGGVAEVLAPVPTFDEWKQLKIENKQLEKFCEEFNALNVSKENAKLKELLKKARDILEDEGDYMIVQKIDEVLR